MKPQSTSSYDVDNRYRFYKSLDSKNDISPNRRGVRRGVDNFSSTVERYKRSLNKARNFRKGSSIDTEFPDEPINVSYDALAIFPDNEDKKILQNLTSFSLNRSF